MESGDYGADSGGHFDNMIRDRRWRNYEEDVRRLKNKHRLNEDPEETAKQFFEQITTLQSICLAAYEVSRVFTPTRDDARVLESVEMVQLRRRWNPAACDEQDWDSHEKTKLPAIMRADPYR